MTTMTLKSVVPPPPAGGGTITVSHWGLDCAPHVAWFEVTDLDGGFPVPGPTPPNVYDPRDHELTCIWNFDDAANSAPTLNLKVPPAWRDLNKAYGRKVQHMFTQPGSYTPSVEVYYQGDLIASITVDTPIVVTDQDAQFPGTQTILMDLTGAGDAAYPSAEIVSDVTLLQGAILGGSGHKRVLFRKGETFSRSDGQRLLEFDRTLNRSLYLGAFGSGADPVVFASVGVMKGQFPTYTPNSGTILVRRPQGGFVDFVAQDITFDGGWNASKETGEHQNALHRYTQDLDVGIIPWHFLRCTFTGMSSFDAFNTFPRDLAVSFEEVYRECLFTNWYAFGIFGLNPTYEASPGGEKRFGQTGCAYRVDERHMHGANDQDGFFWNNHGSFRLGWPTMHFEVVENYPEGGWSEGSRFDGLALNNANPAYRLNYDNDRGRIFMSRIVVEGNCQFQHADSGGGIGGPVMSSFNCVMDKVIHLCSPRAFQMLNAALACSNGGLTIRNYHGTYFRVPRYMANHPQAFIGINANGEEAENKATPIRIYSATFLDLRNDADANGRAFLALQDYGTFDTVFFENVTTYDANRSSPTQDNAGQDLDVTTNLLGAESQYPGPQWNFNLPRHTLASDVANGQSVVVPYPTDALWDRDGVLLPGTAFNQAQCVANAGPDSQIQTDNGVWMARNGHFSIDYEPGGVRLTNTTGGTWPSGTVIDYRLDIYGLHPGPDTFYGTKGMIVPAGIPNPGSTARGTATTGLVAVDDLFGNIRPKGQQDKGAVQASGIDTLPVFRGPYESQLGATYWFRHPAGDMIDWWVGFDIDGDPAQSPDVFSPLRHWLDTSSANAPYKMQVEAQARADGWLG